MLLGVFKKRRSLGKIKKGQELNNKCTEGKFLIGMIKTVEGLDFLARCQDKKEKKSKSAYVRTSFESSWKIVFQCFPYSLPLKT